MMADSEKTESNERNDPQCGEERKGSIKQAPYPAHPCMTLGFIETQKGTCFNDMRQQVELGYLN